LEHVQQVRDVARAALDSATAQLDLARAQRGMAESRVVEAQGRVTQSAPVDQQVAAARAAAALTAARVKAAEVASARAKLQRSYASVTSPVTGMVSKLGAHPGQTIAMGQTLLMVVPVENFVIANFKEGQIARMHPGDAVDIELDAFPGQALHGVIETMSPATGARFSLIPPDNATGNFVKVVQRVPVKITWTQPPTMALRPGLSAEVVVHVK
ncbi:MAG: efflux RND transporter periplasmic adaptor subunit, partial [Proteobacteria bacterium]|nr:efflux RND transporter periplasmic adaptor subunit [Pseudomonadota bacterium]